MNRRTFLQASTALAVAGTAAAEAPAPPLLLVDTHQHLWDLKKFHLPWLEKDSKLAHDFVSEDYARATAGLHVVKAVYMEVDVAPEQHLAEVQYVTGVCKRADTPTVAAVVGGRPAGVEFGKYLDHFRDNVYIKGVRQVLHSPNTPPGTCLKEGFVRGVRLLGERGLSFDLCMRPAELLDARKLIALCPDTRFILDHCGNADVKARDLSQWKKDIAEVAKLKNVVGKVSGIVAGAVPDKWTAEDLRPAIEHTLSVFGPDRVMFGGDWPVCTLTATYKQWVEALFFLVADRPEAERRKLFHDNAVRFYGLA
jgi:L-fuconolactonase